MPIPGGFCLKRCVIDNRQRQPIEPTYLKWNRAKLCWPKDHLKTPKYLCFPYNCCMSYANWMCCKPFPIHGCPKNRELALFQKQQEMKRRRGCLPVCDKACKQRFTMKQFQCIPARIDCKRKAKPKQCTPEVSPPCYPRFCCRCPGCCNF